MLKASFDIDRISWATLSIEQMPIGLAYLEVMIQVYVCIEQVQVVGFGDIDQMQVVFVEN